MKAAATRDQLLPYVVQPDGTKKYIRATVGDVVMSVVLPLYGVLIGLIALAKGESRRAGTMMLLGAVFIVVETASWGIL